MHQSFSSLLFLISEVDPRLTHTCNGSQLSTQDFTWILIERKISVQNPTNRNRNSINFFQDWRNLIKNMSKFPHKNWNESWSSRRESKLGYLISTSYHGCFHAFTGLIKAGSVKFILWKQPLPGYASYQKNGLEI